MERDECDDRGGGDGQLQPQVAPAQVARELAEAHADVHEGRSRDWGFARELGVAQPGDRGGGGRDEVGDQHRRAGVVVRGGAGEDEDAASDDAAHAEHEEVARVEIFAEGRRGRGLRRVFDGESSGDRAAEEARRRVPRGNRSSRHAFPAPSTPAVWRLDGLRRARKASRCAAVEEKPAND